MNCPVCGGKVTCVDSRSNCERVYRRRKCNVCGHVFHTTESELPSSRNDFLIVSSKCSEERKKRKKAMSEYK